MEDGAIISQLMTNNYRHNVENSLQMIENNIGWQNSCRRR
jgi:hypothetical protein